MRALEILTACLCFWLVVIESAKSPHGRFPWHGARRLHQLFACMRPSIRHSKRHFRHCHAHTAMPLIVSLFVQCQCGWLLYSIFYVMDGDGDEILRHQTGRIVMHPASAASCRNPPTPGLLVLQNTHGMEISNPSFAADFWTRKLQCTACMVVSPYQYNDTPCGHLLLE